MGGFNDRNFNARMVKNMLNNIISKVAICCDLMVEELKISGKKIVNHEEVIRDYLFHNYLNNDNIRERIGLTKFLFIPEVPENYENNRARGRVDLKVINKDTFQFTGSYFVIECKRIDGSKRLNKKYVIEGIDRFVGTIPALYKSFYKRNCMFGFIVREVDINLVISQINDLQNEEYPAIIINNEIVADKKMYNTYVSSYLTDEEEIDLHHLFYDFSHIIE